jgi:hypothetical protein
LYASKRTPEARKIVDKVILDRNPFKVNRLDIVDVKDVETIKEGKAVYAQVRSTWAEDTDDNG